MAKSWFHSVLFLLIPLFNLLWIQTCSSTKEGLGSFPVFISKDSRSRYYSTKKHSWERSNKVKRLQVYDDFECVLQCSRMGRWCESINYKAENDGLCEIILADKREEPTHLISFEHLSLEPPIHKSCVEVYKNDGKTNGVYKIDPPIDFPPMYISCDMQTSQGGWTVIQRRIDGSVDFYRDWNEFKRGFGDKLGEYWLGLDIIHSLTSQGDYKLRIDMEDFAGNTRYAEYDKFIVADERDNYQLSIDKYSGDAGDSLLSHNAQQFSTKDRDNDKDVSQNCAVKYKGAWWHKSCHFSNLNGQYLQDSSQPVTPQGAGIIWSKFPGNWEPLKKAEMKIRPLNY